MDNNNTNVTNATPVAPTPNAVSGSQVTSQVSQPVSTPPVMKQTPIEKIKNKFNSLPKNTKILVIVVVGVFLIIFLLSVFVGLFGRKKVIPVATPSPTPIAETPIPNVILNASRYATDSGVLKIESDLQGFSKQLDGSDVKLSDLTLPNLDFNINFNQ